MDADDVSVPDRFEKQLPADRGGRGHRRLGPAGSSGASVDDVVGRRTPPTDPDEIRRVDPLPRPLQPPDRRLPAQCRAVAAGGYADMALMEDYLLFTRMVAGGARAGQPGRAAGALPGG